MMKPLLAFGCHNEYTKSLLARFSDPFVLPELPFPRIGNHAGADPFGGIVDLDVIPEVGPGIEPKLKTSIGVNGLFTAPQHALMFTFIFQECVPTVLC